MGTNVFPCGCSISSSMFGDHPVMGVTACGLHASDVNLQVAMKVASNIVRTLATASEQQSKLQEHVKGLHKEDENE